MKKMLVVLVMASVAFMASGCAVRKHCFVEPGLLEINEVTVGSIMIKKWECFGRITVNRCRKPLEVIYLGRTHPGNYIRIASRVGSRTPFITETTYPGDSNLIEFKDAKIEVIEANDNRIRFKLISISASGCNRMNGQEVK